MTMETISLTLSDISLGMEMISLAMKTISLVVKMILRIKKNLSLVMGMISLTKKIHSLVMETAIVQSRKAAFSRQKRPDPLQTKAGDGLESIFILLVIYFNNTHFQTILIIASNLLWNEGDGFAQIK